jgi:hypothetical protein
MDTTENHTSRQPDCAWRPRRHPRAEVIERDQALEQQIDGAYRRLLEATTRDGRRRAWRLMLKGIRRRSPQQVAAMERARGLRK